MIRSSRAVIVGILIAVTWSQIPLLASQRAADPTVAQLLAAAGRYVATYESSFGAVVAEERHQQSTNGPAKPQPGEPPSRRTSVGNVLMFNSGGAGWMAFRTIDVLDNAELPGPKGRLAALAADPTHERLAEIMRATQAIEWLSIGGIPRAPAIPTAALAYLRASRQPLGVFEFDGMKTVGGVRVGLLKYSQRPAARTTDADDFTITGRFWIEPESGRVVQTEIAITSGTYETKVEVQYASQPGVGFWVPVRMFEQHTIDLDSPSGANNARGGASTKAYADGLSTYQSFRRFDLKPALLISR